MRNSAWLISLLLVSCDFLYETDSKYLPDQRANAAVVLQTRLISSDLSNVVLESDVVLLDYYTEVGDISFLTKKEFSLSTNANAVSTIQSFDSQKSFNALPRSATTILINQSGDYSIYDPFNNRSKAITKLMEDLEESQQIIVGGFAKEGLISEPVEYGTANFSGNYQEQLPFVFNLAKRTGGKNNLYDAINNALEKLTTAKISGDVIVLSKGQDEGSAETLNSITNKAKVSNTRIHIVYLGETSSSTAFSILSQQTSGVFSQCPNSSTMITALGNLARLTSGKSNGYRIRINYKKSSGQFSPGEEISVTMSVTDPYDNYTYNPIVISYKLP